MAVSEVDTECLPVRALLHFWMGSFTPIFLAQDPIVALNNCRSMPPLSDGLKIMVSRSPVHRTGCRPQLEGFNEWTNTQSGVEVCLQK